MFAGRTSFAAWRNRALEDSTGIASGRPGCPSALPRDRKIFPGPVLWRGRIRAETAPASASPCRPTDEPRSGHDDYLFQFRSTAIISVYPKSFPNNGMVLGSPGGGIAHLAAQANSCSVIPLSASPKRDPRRTLQSLAIPRAVGRFSRERRDRGWERPRRRKTSRHMRGPNIGIFGPGSTPSWSRHFPVFSRREDRTK